MKMNKHEQDIFSSLYDIKRDGIEDLRDFLENSDYFTAPCSTKHHLACKHGLVRHSLNVYKLLKDKVDKYDINVHSDTVLICGLLHDVCKVNFYKEEEKWKKVNNQWESYVGYSVDDKNPLGHGEKSVIVLQNYIRLTKHECAAIRWHMTGFDASIHFDYPNGYAYRNAVEQFPLVTLLFTADYEASNIIESKGETEDE